MVMLYVYNIRLFTFCVTLLIGFYIRRFSHHVVNIAIVHLTRWEFLCTAWVHSIEIYLNDKKI